MILNLGGLGKSKRHMPPSFYLPEGTQYLYAQRENADGTFDWELALLGSCSVTFSRVPAVDVFFCAGGAAGAWGSGDAIGGGGGRGGQIVTWTGVTLTENVQYPITIGGNWGNTEAFGQTVYAGQGSGGGFGAFVQGTAQLQAATVGGDGYPAFVFSAQEDCELLTALIGRKYGAGGGGGACRTSAGVSSQGDHTDGGASGGGAGGSDASSGTARHGGNGLANTGGGGGGAAMDGLTGTTGTPGAGGSGILIIRNAR